MNFDSLLKNAYTPYSSTQKACVVIDSSGRCFQGIRVENLSYPLSISHIQAAIYSCLGNGGKPEKLILNDAHQSSDLIHFWSNEYGLSVEINSDFTWEPVNIFEQIEPSKVVQRLEELCNIAVIPNSDFPVSCLIETNQGFVAGVNVECSNWELGLCAERVAIATALSHGVQEMRSIHVLAPKSDYVSPCGGCRQVLMEHLPEKRVYLYQNERELLTVTTSQLLPYHFKSDSLKK